jgi:hypothetical protein
MELIRRFNGGAGRIVHSVLNLSVEEGERVESEEDVDD